MHRINKGESKIVIERTLRWSLRSTIQARYHRWQVAKGQIKEEAENRQGEDVQINILGDPQAWTGCKYCCWYDARQAGKPYQPQTCYQNVYRSDSVWELKGSNSWWSSGWCWIARKRRDWQCRAHTMAHYGKDIDYASVHLHWPYTERSGIKAMIRTASTGNVTWTNALAGKEQGAERPGGGFWKKGWPPAVEIEGWR